MPSPEMEDLIFSRPPLGKNVILRSELSHAARISVFSMIELIFRPILTVYMQKIRPPCSPHEESKL
jgi:hypothetical protein